MNHTALPCELTSWLGGRKRRRHSDHEMVMVYQSRSHVASRLNPDASSFLLPPSEYLNVSL